MTVASSLLIEDHKPFADGLIRRFQREGLQLEWAPDWSAGFMAFAVGGHELVIADYNLQDAHHGLKLLAKVKALSPGTRLILISGELLPEAEQLVADSQLVDLYLVKGPGITDALLAEAREAATRGDTPTDWPALAAAILGEQSLDYEKIDQIDSILKGQIDDG